MENKIVFENIILDDAPLEKIMFDASTGNLIFEADLENEQRISFIFKTIRGMKQSPSLLFDRAKHYINNEYKKTVIQIHDSDWIVKIKEAELSEGERISNKLEHYLIPSDDWVWEILANDCQIITRRI